MRAWIGLGANLDDALFYLKRATRLDSPLVACHAQYNLHRAYLDLGDRPRAIEHLQAALSRDPEFAPALDALSDLMFPGGERTPDELLGLLAGSPVLVPVPSSDPAPRVT